MSEVDDGCRTEPGTSAGRASDGAASESTHATSPDGVDLSLIRWMMTLTPEERLDALQGFVDSTLSLRDAAEGT